MTKKVTELSLFTGMGGGIYGSLILGWKTLAYVERDPYCQKVIKQRIKDGWFDDGHVYGDIKEFNKKHAKKYTGKIDVLTGGFPCQPFSVAGKRKGTSDDRYLFDEIIKTIKIVQPRRLLFENVPGILSSDAIIKIYQSLIKNGYQPKAPLVLGSSDCGNIHKRERVWIYADQELYDSNTTSHRCNDRQNNWKERQIYPTAIRRSSQNKSTRVERFAGVNSNNDVYPTNPKLFGRIKGLCNQETTGNQQKESETATQSDSQTDTIIRRKETICSIDDLVKRPDIPQPLLCGVVDELSNWSQQLKATGNGQDPVVMAAAWNILNSEKC